MKFAGVHLIIGDVRELYVCRGKPSEPTAGDPWDRPDERDLDQIEPPPEPPEADDAGRN